MLSNFGRSDGGRETWAYQFIPRLLERYPGHRLRIFGFRVEGEPDSTDDLLSVIPADTRSRVDITFLTAAPSRIPNAFLFARALRRSLPQPLEQVRLVLAVGSFVELAAVLVSRAFPNAGKLVWLRSIFAAEKAHRYPPSLRRLVERVERAFLAKADVIVANGEDTAAPYRLSGLSVDVIPNAVDLERWHGVPPALLAPIKVAFIGRLTPPKGIDHFLSLAREISDRGFRFHVIGDGPSRSNVEEEARSGRIHFHGAVPNAVMPDLLRDMDVCVALTFVQSQLWSGSGGAGVSNALLEQMAAARVMVCWDNDAFRQVLDERSAYFVPQGDAGMLAAVLLALLEHGEEATRKAAAAAQKACTYDFGEHMRLFESVTAPWLARDVSQRGLEEFL